MNLKTTEIKMFHFFHFLSIDLSKTWTSGSFVEWKKSSIFRKINFHFHFQEIPTSSKQPEAEDDEGDSETEVSNNNKNINNNNNR